MQGRARANLTVWEENKCDCVMVPRDGSLYKELQASGLRENRVSSLLLHWSERGRLRKGDMIDLRGIGGGPSAPAGTHT